MSISGKVLRTGTVALGALSKTVVAADGTVPMAADLAMGGFKLTGLTDGTAAGDAATKGQIDSVSAGLSWKNKALVATAAALPASTYANGTAGVGATLTASGVGVLTVDGVATVLGDRLLVKDQISGLENGIYSVTTEGTAGAAFVLTRETDADVSAELDSATLLVSSGTANADTSWTQTANAPTIGTTSLTWSQFGPSLSFGAAPTTIQPDDAASAGVAGTAARSDHTHGIVGAVAVAVGAANSEGVATSFARSDHVHSAPALTANDKDLTPSATVADFDTTGLTITAAPALAGYVRIDIDGMGVDLGDGVRTKDCYFSSDGGTTAKAINAIAAADTLYWVGSVAGFELAVTDRLNFNYMV